MHLDGLVHLARVHLLGLDREGGRIAHEHVHEGGAGLRAVGVVRRAGVLALVALVDAREQQRAVRHDGDAVDLVGLQQPLVLRPGDVLQGRVRLYVAVHNAGHAERQVLDGRVERDFRRICQWSIVTG